MSLRSSLSHFCPIIEQCESRVLNTTGLASLHAQVNFAPAHHSLSPQAQPETLDLLVIRNETGRKTWFTLEVKFTTPEGRPGVEKKPIDAKPYNADNPETSYPFFGKAKESPTFTVYYNKKPPAGEPGPKTGYFAMQDVTPAVVTLTSRPPDIDKYIRDSGSIWAIVQLNLLLQRKR
jgi:hypothetical protein